MRPDRVIPFLLAVLLSACATAPTLPKVVEVPVHVIVEVPEALTRDCHDEAPKSQRVEEAVRLAKVRKASLVECTARMRQIRALKR